MSDEADLAQEAMERAAELQRKYTHRPLLEVGHTGYCLSCGEPLREPHRWCDVFCRNEWQKRNPR